MESAIRWLRSARTEGKKNDKGGEKSSKGGAIQRVDLCSNLPEVKYPIKTSRRVDGEAPKAKEKDGRARER